MTNIIKVCQLKADGFTISFNFQKLNYKDQFVSCEIEVLFEKQLNISTMQRKNCYLSIKDLQRLNTYFDNHISNLRVKWEYESCVFVNSELDFSLQALAGEIEGGEGKFSIRFMLNIGRSNEDTNVYVGAEGAISLEEVVNFQTSITKLLSKISN